MDLSGMVILRCQSRQAQPGQNGKSVSDILQ
jgi:hypothetical protein